MEVIDMLYVEQKRYERLEERVKWLECLEAAGVDNWQGYEHAVDIWEERYGEEDED